MGGIIIRPRSRILHGHDWVFSSEVLKVFGEPADGDVISIKDGKDRMLGSAIYNSKSQIVARRFSHRRQDLDADFFQRRLERAAEYRARRGVNPQLQRVVWSESDGLPGVIVDRYGEHFVLQTLTLAMDQRKELIAGAMMAKLGAKQIIERNDSAIRRAEGLDMVSGVMRGAPPDEIEVDVDGLKFSVDLLHSHKTGFYLDQLSHYAAVAEFAKDRRVLDCFANQGAFATSCARGGAADVSAVEESEDALVLARRNAERNTLNVRWHQDDVFRFLRGAEKAGAQYDLIILDPPSFTKTKGGLKDALRGYKELHVRAFNLLSRDGILATFSCSHHVPPSAFDQTISDALVDARRSARRLRRFEQALDHPVLPAIPETEYFKGVLLEMMPSR